MTVATPRVLVVSESRITRRVIEMTFADQPLQLAVFADGAAAVDDWRNRPPAVLIADITLPGTDGYALARQLRDQPAGQKACVILLAAQAESIDEAAAAAIGTSAVLRKPLDSHQLVDAVRGALRSGPPAPATVAMAQPVAVTANAGAAVAVAEPPPVVASEDVALLLGRESALDGEPGAGGWSASPGAGASDRGLADAFHALVEVERHAGTAAPSTVSDDADLDRIARRVAAILAADGDARQRLDAALVDRAAVDLGAAARAAVERLAPEQVAAAVASVVAQMAPAMVREMAQAAVREEIARLRAARGV